MSHLSEHIEVEAPEHVAFRYELAGIGSRVVAGLVDHLLLGGLCSLILLGMCAVRVSAPPSVDLAPGEGVVVRGVSSLAMALGVLLLFCLVWGYNTFFEVVMNGQTPGKRWSGLRVVTEGGYPVGLWDSLLRNLMRAVDIQPAPFMPYGAALLVMLLNRESKRLGDYVGGTIVIKEREASGAEAWKAEDYVARRGGPLTPEQFRLVRRFLDRTEELRPERAEQLAEQLARPFTDEFGRPGETPADLLERLAAQHEAQTDAADEQSSE